MQTDLITKVYFNEHLTHSCVGMPQGLQALLSSFSMFYPVTIATVTAKYIFFYVDLDALYNAWHVFQVFFKVIT